jgi:Flp pilus assembly protein TadD
MTRAAPFIGLAVLLAVTALAYAPSLDGPFVLDDWRVVQANMDLRRADALRVPSVAGFLGSSRVVTQATLVLDWRAAGLAPRRYHVVGLAMHLATVAAAFAFLLRLLSRSGHPRPRATAFVVAALFALHPVQVESVAYVSQRAEVLASLLYLVTLLFLGEAALRGSSWRGLLSWAGGAATWVIAMGAKAIAISVPGAFVLQQAIVAPPTDRGGRLLGRRTLRAAVLVAPLLALGAWSAVLQFQAFEAAPGGGAGFRATPLTPLQYLFTQLRVQWLYLRLLAWPRGFAFDRTFEPSLVPDPAVVVAALGIAALVAAALWLWRLAERRQAPLAAARLCAFGILFWFVALSPTSSVVPVMDLAVEHRMYLASLGPFLAGTVAIDWALHRWTSPRTARVASRAAAGVVLVTLALLLRARAETWGSPLALWRDAAATSPGSARVLTNLALELHERGDVAGSEASYRKAWTVVRQPGVVIDLARNHSALLTETGRPGEALLVVDRGLALAPDDPGLRANRAAALGQLGRPVEALEEARRAAAAAPGDPLMRNNLGQALAVNGDWPGALAEFREAEALDPGAPVYPAAAGISLVRLGRRDEACAALRRAASRSGNRPLPLNADALAAGLGCTLREAAQPRAPR